MAGMLPGVESARRRRFHQSGGWSDSPSTCGSIRRPTFCLYSGNHKSPHLTSTGSSMQRYPTSQTNSDERMVEAAREAKERLDERLRARWKQENKRGSGEEESSSRGSSEMMRPGRGGGGNMGSERVGELKKSGSKRLGWGKLSWKSSDQDECAVCLEEFRPGKKLMQLPCAHRFHSRCLLPWLESNSHCPCCRMGILP